MSNIRRVLVVALSCVMLMGLATASYAHESASYTGSNISGSLGPVIHHSENAQATATTEYNWTGSAYIGATVKYLEYYFGYWHTTDTTVGSTNVWDHEYSRTKVTWPPSTCRTTKFHSKHYYNNSYDRALETTGFLVCPE